MIKCGKTFSDLMSINLNINKFRNKILFYKSLKINGKYNHNINHNKNNNNNNK